MGTGGCPHPLREWRTHTRVQACTRAHTRVYKRAHTRDALVGGESVWECGGMTGGAPGVLGVGALGVRV